MFKVTTPLQIRNFKLYRTSPNPEIPWVCVTQLKHQNSTPLASSPHIYNISWDTLF